MKLYWVRVRSTSLGETANIREICRMFMRMYSPFELRKLLEFWRSISNQNRWTVKFSETFHQRKMCTTSVRKLDSKWIWHNFFHRVTNLRHRSRRNALQLSTMQTFKNVSVHRQREKVHNVLRVTYKISCL